MKKQKVDIAKLVNERLAQLLDKNGNFIFRDGSPTKKQPEQPKARQLCFWTEDWLREADY